MSLSLHTISHWFLTGTLINTIGVIIGGFLGMLIGKLIPDKLSKRLMEVLGLCTLLIGLTGAVLSKTFDGDDKVYSQNIMLIILSLVIGTLIGELLDLDGKINRLGSLVQKKISKNDGTVSIAEGFVSASLLFCVGAMAIVGSIESGLTGDNSTIFAKTLLDFIASIVFASTLGIGVVLSSAFVLTYQGFLTVTAHLAGSVLSNYMISQMSFVGNLVIIALALNMMNITKFKVMNMVPAIFIPIILCLFM
jgi:uncharacterized membrane protein YqgA involved in biofilm formation